MKKLSVVFAIVLVALTMTLASCSSKSDSNSQSSSTGARGTKSSSEKEKIDPKAAALYDDVDSALSDGFAASCATLSEAYGRFQNPGDDSDGFGEIDSLSDVPFQNTLLLSNQISDIENSDASSTQLDDLADTLTTAKEKFDSIQQDLFDIGTSDISSASDRAAQVDRVGSLVQDYRDYVEEIGYGPCS